MLRVSVVMPVYNGERFLAAAIESVLSQTFSDFEFIIVDDGSRDGSARTIQDYAKRDSRIRVIEHRDNRGEASARNTGIAAATGDYIAGMDADDVSLPERLRRQAEFLDAHAEIGGVGVSARRVSEDLKPIQDYKLPASHALIAYDILAGGPALIRSTVMTRRDLLVESGGYDARLSNRARL